MLIFINLLIITFIGAVIISLVYVWMYVLQGTDIHDCQDQLEEELSQRGVVYSCMDLVCLWKESTVWDFIGFIMHACVRES